MYYKSIFYSLICCCLSLNGCVNLSEYSYYRHSYLHEKDNDYQFYLKDQYEKKNLKSNKEYENPRIINDSDIELNTTF